MKCTHKAFEYNCEQFVNHPHKGDFKVDGTPGTSGYNAKLGYMDTPEGKRVTVRPGDWILSCGISGQVKVMTNDQFKRDYDLTLEKPKKLANNGKHKISGQEVDNASQEVGAH